MGPIGPSIIQPPAAMRHPLWVAGIRVLLSQILQIIIFGMTRQLGKMHIRAQLLPAISPIVGLPLVMKMLASPVTNTRWSQIVFMRHGQGTKVHLHVRPPLWVGGTRHRDRRLRLTLKPQLLHETIATLDRARRRIPPILRLHRHRGEDQQTPMLTFGVTSNRLGLNRSIRGQSGIRRRDVPVSRRIHRHVLPISRRIHRHVLLLRHQRQMLHGDHQTNLGRNRCGPASMPEAIEQMHGQIGQSDTVPIGPKDHNIGIDMIR